MNLLNHDYFYCLAADANPPTLPSMCCKFLKRISVTLVMFLAAHINPPTLPGTCCSNIHESIKP